MSHLAPNDLSIVHADSTYDAPQAGKTRGYTSREMENPWLLVMEPRTTTRARVRPANNYENC